MESQILQDIIKAISKNIETKKGMSIYYLNTIMLLTDDQKKALVKSLTESVDHFTDTSKVMMAEEYLKENYDLFKTVKGKGDITTIIHTFMISYADYVSGITIEKQAISFAQWLCCNYDNVGEQGWVDCFNDNSLHTTEELFLIWKGKVK